MTLYEKIMSEMTIEKMAAMRLVEESYCFYASDGTVFRKRLDDCYEDAICHEVEILNREINV